MGFYSIVERSWNQPARGTLRQRLWYKLHRLRPHLLKLNKFTNDIQKNKLAAREKLDQAQQDLRNNIMDAPRIEEVKRLTD